ncbi:prepilin-type N-terminal cleavage/methylation domain-containing protein [Moritella sp. 24]|nr:prepilin-type N-terminal cleavage/methylation domain-containing protein [Moritella sp. 24]
MDRKHSKNKGFTLIELVIIIIILGTLAATAIPKFINLKNDAKTENLESIQGSMKSALQLVYSRALIQGQNTGDGRIDINGVEVPLYNAYPSVDGSDSVAELNEQVKAWLDIDSVDAATAAADKNAAPFYTAKSTAKNYIFIFFSSDRDQMNSSFRCQVRYENPVTTAPRLPVVTIKTDSC